MKAEMLEKQDTHQLMNETTFFDEYGRCIPHDLKAPVHVKTRRYFQIENQETDYAASYARLDKAFHIAKDISLAEFEQRIETLVQQLALDDASKGILDGVMVPFILPKASFQDIGQVMETEFLPAVNEAFLSVYPDYSFKNHSPKALNGQLAVTPNSRHQQLLDVMKEELVVGLYFPCLLEYSVPSAIEQLNQLPENFCLSGGFDTAAAFISQPGLLYRKDGYPPLLWLAGAQSVEDNVGYHFEAYGYDLTFNRRVHLGQVAEYWASAITVIG